MTISYTRQVCIVTLLFSMAECHTGGLYDMTCCAYCRSEPSAWIKVGQTYTLSEATLDDPAAYLINDVEEQTSVHGGQNSAPLTLRYAGAPLKLEYGLETESSEWIGSQFYQIDLAGPKYFGGFLTQGGFYEEATVGFYPYTESWVTQYAISYSNSSDSFKLVTEDNGNLQIYTGNVDSQGIRINSLSPGIVARYIRLHPLEAKGAIGSVKNVNFRVSPIVCAREPCLSIRIDCLLSDWSGWGECGCTSSGCHYERTRHIRRIQSCGGEKCAALKESVPCTPPEPAWKSVAQYLGIAIAVVLVVGLVVLIIYKKKQKNRVEVIVVREHEDMEGEEDQGPVVLPRGPKAREAKQGQQGFHHLPGWDMDPLYDRGENQESVQHTFTRQLPRPPVFQLDS